MTTTLDIHQILKLLPPGQGILHRLMDIPFRLLQPADILPGDVRDLKENLPHGAWPHLAKGLTEVPGLHLHHLQDLRRDLVCLQVDLGEVAAQRLYSGLTRQGGKVRPDKPMSLPGNLFDQNVICKRHAACVYLEHLGSIVFRWHTDLDLAVKPPGAAEGGVDGIDPVCGPYHHDLSPLFKPVHHR